MVIEYLITPLTQFERPSLLVVLDHISETLPSQQSTSNKPRVMLEIQTFLQTTDMMSGH